jgi:hypothetical protein
MALRPVVPRHYYDGDISNIAINANLVSRRDLTTLPRDPGTDGELKVIESEPSPASRQR